MTRLSPAEADRVRTWNLAIAAVIIGFDVPFEDIGHDRKWSGLGGFSVDRRDGGWFCHATGEGGHDTVAMVRFLQKGSAWTDASAWILSWLTAHPGTGPCTAEVGDDDESDWRRRLSADRARNIIAEARPIADTDGERYLISRGLGSAPYPLELRWLPDARTGEGAIVTELRASNRTVAIMLTFVDALGSKSTIEPKRIRLNLEPHRPDAIMEIAAAMPGTVDIAADTIVVEGLENGLALARVKNPAWRIIALPGIGVLRHLPTRQGERIIVFQDSDPPDSPAADALQAGVDALILAGARVRVTERAAGDANALLQDPEHGEAGLKRLLAKPAGGALSFSGEVDRLTKLSPTAYEQARKAAAAAHGVRVGHLDREVAHRRPKPLVDDEEATESVLSVPEDPPWTEPIPPLSTVLDTILEVLRRFVVVSLAQAVAVTLWTAAAHLLQSTKVNLHLFPKLAVQSKDPVSGKTTLLTLVWNILPRAKLWTYPSGAFLVRAIEQGHPSLCLDELQYAEDRNLLRVINAAHQRSLAYVPLLVPNKFGGWAPREFPVWVPMALARLGEFSTAQQSRSIVIWMLPKLPGDKCQRLRRPEVPELVLCRRQLAAWADTVPAWIDPAIPTALRNRDVDNWESLLFVADLAGGDWPEQARAMAKELMKTERQPTITERLLSSTWKIFQPDPDKGPTAFLTSQELRDALIADPEEDWGTVNRGREITYEYLREKLSHLLDPPGSQQDNYHDEDGKRRNRRGYSFAQFMNANDRYLAGIHPLTPSGRPSSPASPGSDPEEVSNPADSSEAGAEPGEQTGEPHPLQEASDEPSKSAKHAGSASGEAGEEGRSAVDIRAYDTPSEAAATPSPAAPLENSSAEREPAVDPMSEGAAEPPSRPPNYAEQLIRECRDEHPDWSPKQIARKLHRPLSQVERALNEGAPT